MLLLRYGHDLVVEKSNEFLLLILVTLSDCLPCKYENKNTARRSLYRPDCASVHPQGCLRSETIHIGPYFSKPIALGLMPTHLMHARRSLAADSSTPPYIPAVHGMIKAAIMIVVRTYALLSTVGYATTSGADMSVTKLAVLDLFRQLWVLNATLMDSLAAVTQSLVATAMASQSVMQARRIAIRAAEMSVISSMGITVPVVLVGSRLPALRPVCDLRGSVRVGCTVHSGDDAVRACKRGCVCYVWRDGGVWISMD